MVGAIQACNIGWRRGLDLHTTWGPDLVPTPFSIFIYIYLKKSNFLKSQLFTQVLEQWLKRWKKTNASGIWSRLNMETWLSCHFRVQVFKNSLNGSYGPKRWKITFTVYTVHNISYNSGMATWQAQSRPPSVLTHSCSQPNTTVILFPITSLSSSLPEKQFYKSLNRKFYLNDDDRSTMLNTASSVLYKQTNKQTRYDELCIHFKSRCKMR